MDVRKRVGLNLQRIRRGIKGLSQEKLAHRAKIHQTYLSGVETGKRNPSIGVLGRIVTALGADMRSYFVSHGLIDADRPFGLVVSKSCSTTQPTENTVVFQMRLQSGLEGSLPPLGFLPNHRGDHRACGFSVPPLCDMPISRKPHVRSAQRTWEQPVSQSQQDARDVV